MNFITYLLVILGMIVAIYIYSWIKNSQRDTKYIPYILTAVVTALFAYFINTTAGKVALVIAAVIAIHFLLDRWINKKKTA